MLVVVEMIHYDLQRRPLYTCSLTTSKASFPECLIFFSEKHEVRGHLIITTCGSFPQSWKHTIAQNVFVKNAVAL